MKLFQLNGMIGWKHSIGPLIHALIVPITHFDFDLVGPNVGGPAVI